MSKYDMEQDWKAIGIGGLLFILGGIIAIFLGIGDLIFGDNLNRLWGGVMMFAVGFGMCALANKQLDNIEIKNKICASEHNCHVCRKEDLPHDSKSCRPCLHGFMNLRVCNFET